MSERDIHSHSISGASLRSLPSYFLTVLPVGTLKITGFDFGISLETAFLIPFQRFGPTRVGEWAMGL